MLKNITTTKGYGGDMKGKMTVEQHIENANDLAIALHHMKLFYSRCITNFDKKSKLSKSFFLHMNNFLGKDFLQIKSMLDEDFHQSIDDYQFLKFGHIYYNLQYRAWGIIGNNNLDILEEELVEVKELLAQPEPFKPDWANYRQGVADSKREPLSDTRCPYPEETSGEYRDGFTDGILYAEKHHGIGGIDDYRAKVGLDE